MVAPHSEGTISGLLSNSEGEYSFFLFLSPDYVSHFRAELSGMYCMRLEWRRGWWQPESHIQEASATWSDGCRTRYTIPHKQGQVYECRNANLVSLPLISSIYDRETTQMYLQTLHTHTFSKSPLVFTEVYLISLEDLSSASLILALALGIWSMETPALCLHPAILPCVTVCRWWCGQRQLPPSPPSSDGSPPLFLLCTHHQMTWRETGGVEERKC